MDPTQAAPAVPAVPPPTADPDASAPPRFASLQLPSAPFWVLLIGGIIGAIVLVMSASALLVFALGTAIAFFLVPVVNWLQHHGWPRAGAAIVVVACMVVLTLIGLLVIAFIVVEQGVVFAQQFPVFMADIAQRIRDLSLPQWLEDALASIGAAIQVGLASLDPAQLVIGFVQGLLGMMGLFFTLMLLPFFLFYLLKDQPKMASNFYRNVPAPWKADVDRMLTITSTDIAQYFKSELLVGSIMFVIVSVGMFVIGTVMPGAEILVTFALLLGLIALVMEPIPQIGPILSYIPALILSLTVGPETVVVVSVFYFIIFNIEGSILVPTFQGRMISFSGASVLVLITVGFAIAGIIGAIVALPVAAIARDLFGLFFRRAQEIAGVPPLPRDDPEAATMAEAAVGSAPGAEVAAAG